jgi:hypothetical protein
VVARPGDHRDAADSAGRFRAQRGFVARAPYDPVAAGKLLDKFGYVDKDKDGFRDLPDGKPFTIVMASTPSGRDRERDELWKKNMTSLGIRFDFLKQKWPDLLKMGRAGKLQMWPVGWINTYGEGDAFMQLLYSKNIGQSNYSRFALPEYDELYRKTKRLPDGPERNALYRKMAELVAAYNPWDLGVYRIENTLVRPWVIGYKKHINREHAWQYLDVDSRATAFREVRTALRSRDSRRVPVAGRSRHRLPRPAQRRSIASNNIRTPRAPMSITRNHSPLLSAIAGWTVLRADSGLLCRGAIGDGEPDRFVPDLSRAHAVIAWPDFRQAAGGNRFLSSSIAIPRLSFVATPRLAASPGIAGKAGGSCVLYKEDWKIVSGTLAQPGVHEALDVADDHVVRRPDHRTSRCRSRRRSCCRRRRGRWACWSRSRRCRSRSSACTPAC